MPLENVIFLDRDGVINFDSPDYIKSWNEYRFLPGSLEALAVLTTAGYHMILITNQSMIGRGMVSIDTLEDMHRRMQQAVGEAGGRIFDIFYCPHRPDEFCFCRKPEPGMILKAKARHDIDLSASIMIGDSLKDLACGRNAGCGATILVRTGNGFAAEKALADKSFQPSAVADDLFDAAGMILSGQLPTAPEA